MKKESILVLIGILFFACIKQAPKQTLPYAPAFFRIDINGQDHYLNGALNTKIYTEKDRRTPQDRFGFGGLLVVRDAQGATLFAYDAACPNENNPKTRVVPNNHGEAECPVCHSVYDILLGMGEVKSGTSTLRLQQYRVIPQPRSGEFLVVN